MQTHKAEHLPENKRIRLGGYYTPEKLVSRVYNFVKPYLLGERKKSIIFDSAGGCGAFLSNINGNDYRIADCDAEACNFLKQRFDATKVFHTNSLVAVNRNKYSIPSSTSLIMIGNPPYNDITSEFRSGEKGENICDEDLRDRDLGVSFLRSYNKLKADIVCILHPLPYLIKEANFKRLREFRENYKLTKERPNGIVVTLENFYKYSYLYSLKSLFNPDNSWLYGNLSPLADVEDVERNKNLYVSYAVKTNRVFEQTEKSLPKTIMTHYKIKMEEDVNKIEETIKGRLNSLV